MKAYDVAVSVGYKNWRRGFRAKERDGKGRRRTHGVARRWSGEGKFHRISLQTTGEDFGTECPLLYTEYEAERKLPVGKHCVSNFRNVSHTVLSAMSDQTDGCCQHPFVIQVVYLRACRVS